MRILTIAVVLVLGTLLSGCVDVYLDLIIHDNDSYTIRESWVIPVSMLDEAAARETGDGSRDTTHLDRKVVLDSLMHDDSFIPQNWKYLSHGRKIVTSGTIIDTLAWVTSEVTTSTIDSVRMYWRGALSLNQARIDSVGPTGVEVVKRERGTTVTFLINPDPTPKRPAPRRPSKPDKEMIGHLFHFRLFSPDIVKGSIKPPCRAIAGGAEWPVRFTQIDTLEALCKLPQKVSFMLKRKPIDK